MVITEPQQNIADNGFIFIPTESGIQVTWHMEGKTSNMFNKYILLMMDGFVGKDFKRGLENLKKISEN